MSENTSVKHNHKTINVWPWAISLAIIAIILWWNMGGKEAIISKDLSAFTSLFSALAFIGVIANLFQQQFSINETVRLMSETAQSNKEAAEANNKAAANTLKAARIQFLCAPLPSIISKCDELDEKLGRKVRGITQFQELGIYRMQLLRQKNIINNEVTYHTVETVPEFTRTEELLAPLELDVAYLKCMLQNLEEARLQGNVDDDFYLAEKTSLEKGIDEKTEEFNRLKAVRETQLPDFAKSKMEEQFTEDEA